MAVVKCRCGAETNSAISRYWTRKDWTIDIAEGCYAKWENGGYKKGCLYDDSSADDFMRGMADKLINEIDGDK